MSTEEKDIKKSQAPTLIQCIEKEGKTVSDIANALGVASTQVYKWNREGIKASSKHYEALKSIIPSLQPAEERITAKGKPDGRSNSGVKKKNLVLTETDMPSIKPEKSFKSTLFPKIIFKKK